MAFQLVQTNTCRGCGERAAQWTLTPPDVTYATRVRQKSCSVSSTHFFSPSLFPSPPFSCTFMQTHTHSHTRWPPSTAYTHKHAYTHSFDHYLYPHLRPSLLCVFTSQAAAGPWRSIVREMCLSLRKRCIINSGITQRSVRVSFQEQQLAEAVGTFLLLYLHSCCSVLSCLQVFGLFAADVCWLLHNKCTHVSCLSLCFFTAAVRWVSSEGTIQWSDAMWSQS